MGQLARRVEEFPDLSNELKGRIKEALARRNFLIHDYWRQAGYTFATEEGRSEMVAELSKDTDTFEKLASDIMEATKPVRKKLGISEETLNEKVEARMAQLRDGGASLEAGHILPRDADFNAVRPMTWTYAATPAFRSAPIARLGWPLSRSRCGCLNGDDRLSAEPPIHLVCRPAQPRFGRQSPRRLGEEDQHRGARIAASSTPGYAPTTCQ
jgi:hypothetical protein